MRSKRDVAGRLVRCAIVAGALAAVQASTAEAAIDVTRAPYSAVGDGVANDRVAIQQALDDAAARAGGDTVVLPAGRTFLSGGIKVGSDVTLQIDGTLEQSQNSAHYARAPVVGKYVPGSSVPYDAAVFHNDPFVFVDGGENVTITGGGSVQLTVAPGDPVVTTIYQMAVGFLNTDGYTVENIHIRDSNMFNLTLYGTRNGLVQNVTINSSRTNSDGLSVVNSQHVRATGNSITNNDDGMYAVTRIADPRDYDTASWYYRRIRQPSRFVEFDHNTLHSNQGYALRPTIAGVRDMREVETTDVYVHDNSIRARLIDPIGCYADHESAPLTRFRIVGNTYVDDAPGRFTLGWCAIADFENDLGAFSTATLRNGDFEATGDAWWSPSGDAGSVPVGDTALVPAARAASAQLDGYVGYVQNLGAPAELMEGIGSRGGDELPTGPSYPAALTALFPDPYPYTLTAEVVTSGDPVRLLAYDTCTRAVLRAQTVTATRRTTVTLPFTVDRACSVIRVGLDRGSASAGWGLIDDVRLVRGGGSIVDDNAWRGVTYSGTGWTLYVNTPTRDVYGTRHVGTARRDAVQASFTGRRAWVLGVKSPNVGIFDVYVDGVLATTVDGYSATTQQAAVLYDTGTLTSGTHTVRLVNSGTKNPAAANAYVGFDALAVGP